MTQTDGASSISVAVRVRPFTIREAAQLVKCDDSPLFLGDGSLAAAPTPKLAQKGLRSVIKVVDDRCLIFDPPENNPVQRFSKSVVPQGKRVKDQTFCFDRVFDDNTSQQDVYDGTTRALLDSVLNGYNATVFAYGATGCGKTHTITGTVQQPGIIFLAMQELFERIQELQDEKVTDISLSYLEIYNETIRDLLAPTTSSKQGLMLREDANQSVSVAGLSSHQPKNVQEVMDMIVRGNEYRTMSPTEANAASSRSHAVLQINVSQKDRNADVNEPHTMATLSIIDLAGSERASATKNRGERLLEGANINRSLLALGSCINALCDPRKHNHVPYRNSKLTRLLKFSLGGNCKTVMIVCVSPSSAHFDETQNTLRYANRAKNIQTKVTRNVFNVNRHVKDFLKKIDEQMALINELKAQLRDHETATRAKMRRQNAKRANVLREGIARLHSAYNCAESERTQYNAICRDIRLTEQRITLGKVWVTSLSQVIDKARTEVSGSGGGGANTNNSKSSVIQLLESIKESTSALLQKWDTANEQLNQRASEMKPWRTLDSALETGIRQLREAPAADTDDEISEKTLQREYEVLRSKAQHEHYDTLLEKDADGYAGPVKALSTALIDAISALNQLTVSSDTSLIVSQARDALTSLVSSCAEAAAFVMPSAIKSSNDTSSIHKSSAASAGSSGNAATNSTLTTSLSSSTVNSVSWNGEASSQPRRRRNAALQTTSTVIPATASASSSPSPLRPSPRRRKISAIKKGTTFSQRRNKSGVIAKRGVRWRDDVEHGALADYGSTPKRYDSSPSTVSTTATGSCASSRFSTLHGNSISVAAPLTVSPAGTSNHTTVASTSTNLDAAPSSSPPEMPVTSKSAARETPGSVSNSSPIPTPPQTSFDLKSRNSNRFQTGFLSKRHDSAPSSSPLIMGFMSNGLSTISSGNALSPLRDMVVNAAPHQSCKSHAVSTISSPSPPVVETFTKMDAGKIRKQPKY